MKQTLLLALCAIFMGSLNAQTVEFEDDFEGYSDGDYVGLNSTTWTTWSANGEGTGEDVTVSTEQAQSGTNSAKFEGTGAAGSIDMMLPLGYFFGEYELTWSYYIPDGFGGYFNGQEAANPGVGWAFECYLEDDGTINVISDTQNIGMGSYPQGEWFDIKLAVDLDNDNAVLTVAGVEIFDNLVWDTPLGGINFFGTGGQAGDGLYYLDDLTVTNMTTSIEEISVSPEFNVFPMPANDELNLSWNFGSDVQAVVFDLSGKTVISQQFNALSTAKMDVSDLNEGIYFIQLSHDDINITKKIIVKH